MIYFICKLKVVNVMYFWLIHSLITSFKHFPLQMITELKPDYCHIATNSGAITKYYYVQS